MSDKTNAPSWQPWLPPDFAMVPATEIMTPITRPMSQFDNAHQQGLQDVQPDDLARHGLQFHDLQLHDLQQQNLQQQDLQRQAEERGYQQGFAQGQQEGRDQGYQSGLAEGHQQGLLNAEQQQAPLTAQWQQMIIDFQHTLDSLDNVIAARLMQLALTAAKQVLGQPAMCDGSALLDQIQQLIQQEPLFHGKPQLRVHPDDLPRIEQRLGATLNLHGWHLLADNQLHPGGCKISSKEGELDASLATRWRELCQLAAPGNLS